MPGARAGLAAVVVCAVSMVLTPVVTSSGAASAPTTTPASEAHPPMPPAAAARIGAMARPTYYYASAHSQYVYRARGAKARFTVHRPRQVTRAGDHALAEIAIRGPHLSDIVEAGWRTDSTGVTRLFVYWWKNGEPQCYNHCGFVKRGRGIKPGAVLEPGTRITLKWRFKRGKWKLRVNGELSGFYRKSLWHGRFRRPRLVQVFGEVVTRSSQPCADMGNGRPAWRRGAAAITRVKFVRGPEMRLRRGNVAGEFGYSMRVVNDHKVRYGGRGLC